MGYLIAILELIFSKILYGRVIESINNVKEDIQN